MTDRIIPTSDVAMAPETSWSTAYEAGRVIKASPGVLYGLNGYNSKVTAQFIQLFDAAAVPADTAIPMLVLTVPASSNFSVDLGAYGLAFRTGISVSNSSTGPTKTVGSADVHFTGRFK